MLYLNDSLTLIIRCISCGVEEDTGEHASVMAYMEAEMRGWVCRGNEAIYQGVDTICPDCIVGKKPGGKYGWRAWCNTCEEDDEGDVLTEEDAKDWKKKHRCFEWGPPEPDVTIQSPAQAAASDAESAKYQRESEAKVKERKRQQEEMDRLVSIGMTVSTARKSWWRRLLLRLAGV